MHVILNIDTATEQGIVAVSSGSMVKAARTNSSQRDHAAWVHAAMEEVLQEAGYAMEDLSAIAVVGGPGSYTGVRVGMATAKGLCYVLNIPMIQLNTLVLMAKAVISANNANEEVLYCPMIDARRMEVFTALYDHSLNELLAPRAMVLDKASFSAWAGKKPIIFSGNGSVKWKALAEAGAQFSSTQYTPETIAWLSGRSFEKSAFADVAYAEPVYLKEFYTPAKQSS